MLVNLLNVNHGINAVKGKVSRISSLERGPRRLKGALAA